MTCALYALCTCGRVGAHTNYFQLESLTRVYYALSTMCVRYERAIRLLCALPQRMIFLGYRCGSLVIF